MLKRRVIEEIIGLGVATEIMLLFSYRIFKRMRISVANSDCACWKNARLVNGQGVGWVSTRVQKLLEYVRVEFKRQRGREPGAFPVTVDFDESLVRRIIVRALRRAKKRKG